MKKALKIIATVLIIIVLIIGIMFVYDRATIGSQYKINEKNLLIPILIYHDIVESEEQIQYDYMQTTYETFKKQITGLIDYGYKPITYKDLIEYSKGEKSLYKKSFIVTFDDGYEGVYKYAYPFAKENNIPITSFLINDKVGTDGYYSWDEAREMDKSGLVSIYSHSMKHDNYDKYKPEDLLNDVTTSLAQIEKELGHEVEKVFTYPCGLYSEEGRKLLEENGIIQNLTDSKINQSKTLNLYGLHRMYALEDPVWKILLKIEYRHFRYGG